MNEKIGKGLPFPSEIIPSKEKKYLAELKKQYFKELSLNAIESEGFLHIPKENIAVFPPGTMRNKEGKITNPNNGILQIKEPAKKKGIEEFSQRDKFEKAQLSEMKGAQKYAEEENKIWQTMKIAPQPFRPEIGGRICFYLIKIFENQEGQFLFLPILPKTGQLYSGHTKLGGSNLLRGNNPLRGQNIFKGAFHKEKLYSAKENSALLQNNVSFIPSKAGIWDVHLIDSKNRKSIIQGCQVARDEATGTLDIFQTRKAFLMEDPKDLRVSNAKVDWAYALAKMSNLRLASKNKALPVEQLYLGQKLIERPQQLPPNYQGIFRRQNEGWQIENYQPVPTLEKFLANERRIIDIPKTESFRAQAEIAGEFFEKVLGKIPGVRQLPAKQVRMIPWKNEKFRSLVKKESLEFQDWLRNNEAKLGGITFDPDYLLEDGTYLEAKRTNLNQNQLFKTRLFQLIEALTGKKVKIKYLTLEKSPADEKLLSPFNIEIENFLESSLAKKLPSSDPDLQKLTFLQNKLEEMRTKLAQNGK